MIKVDIAGVALDAVTGAPLVVLRESEEPHRILPIFIGATEAAAIGLALAGDTPTRPLTYDLMATLMDSMKAHVDRVEVTELRDGAFFAEMQVTGPEGGHRFDTRPSDAIALALRVHAPMFVSEYLLDEAGSLPSEVIATAAAEIDEEVEAFTEFLADVSPADFNGEGTNPAE